MNGFQMPALVLSMAVGFITGGIVLFGEVSGHSEVISAHGGRIESSEREIDIVGSQVNDIHRTVVGIEVRQTAILDSVNRIERSLDTRGDTNE